MPADPSAAVTVVIPNWNGRLLLPACLASLQRQSWPRVRVLVVDNGSTDDSVEWLRQAFPQVELICHQRNEGFSAAVNAGIRASQDEYVALLNNDTEADPEWLRQAITAMQSDIGCGYVASRMMDFYQRDRLDSAGDLISRSGLPAKRGMDQPLSELWLRSCEVLGASAGAAVYRRSSFEQTGLFDTGYFLYLEDVDWCLRAALQGISCRYVPQAVVYHIEGGSDPQRADFRARGLTGRRVLHTPERTYWITRNRLRLLLKNYPTAVLFRLAPWLTAGFARSTAFHLLKSGQGRHYFRGLSDGVRVLPEVLQLRSEVQRRKMIHSREFLRRLELY